MKVNEGGSIALFGDVMSKPRISRLIIQLKGNLGNPYGKLLLIANHFRGWLPVPGYLVWAANELASSITAP